MGFRSTWSPNFDCISRSGNQGIALGANTIACWVKWDNLSAGYEAIEINDSGGQPFASAIIIAGTNWEFLQRNAAGGQIQVLSAATAAVWTHVALTWDGTTMTAYVNGASVGTAGPLAGARNNWSDIQLGPGAGEIQDGVFYTAALSAGEIAQLYRARLPKRRNNLRHHLPCFPGTAARLIDYSGNGLNFTNAPAPTDASTAPPVGWGGGKTRVIQAPGNASLGAQGDTQTTGAVSVLRGEDRPASGSTVTTGTATVIPGRGAQGDTQTTGTATVNKQQLLTAQGDTVTTGGASLLQAISLTAVGNTHTFGNASVQSGGAPPAIPDAELLQRRARRFRS